MSTWDAEAVSKMADGLVLLVEGGMPLEALIPAVERAVGDQRLHQVDFRADGVWTLMHPVRERLDGSLMTCEMHKHVAHLARMERPGPVWDSHLGLYWIEIGRALDFGDGISVGPKNLIYTPVEQAP